MMLGALRRTKFHWMEPHENSAKLTTDFRLILPFLAFVVFLMVIVALLAIRPDIHPDLIFVDMLEFVYLGTTDAPPYLSIMSTLGFVLWMMGGIFCGFAALILHRLSRPAGKRIVLYLASLSFLGIFLGFDDMLRLHESLFLHYLGILENVTLTAYGVLFIAIWVFFFPQITSHHMLFIVLFYMLFGFSQVVDVLQVDVPVLQTNPIDTLLEECPKFLGIAAFALYSLYFSYAEIKRHLSKG